jgi:two-component system, chemotaxis family, protein-glutamate methylesterase/glutaminase
VLVEDRLRLSRSATEHRFRPAIDPLLRSAAVTYGPRVVGVLLSGNLDDGTAGLWAVKRQGGVAVIQDPHEALYPSMPQSAATYVPLDHCLPAVSLAPLLVELAQTPLRTPDTPQVPEDLLMETHIALEENALLSGLLTIGQLTPYTCPTCHGVLLQLKAGRFVRFRCHTGHAFSVRSLMAELTASLDDALWNTLRALDESVLLLTHLADHLRAADPTDPTAALCTQQAQDAQQRADQIRQMVMQRPAVPPLEPLEVPPDLAPLAPPPPAPQRRRAPGRSTPDGGVS